MNVTFNLLIWPDRAIAPRILLGKLLVTLFHYNTFMSTRRPIILDLAHEFPQLTSSQPWINRADLDSQWAEFARLVQGLYRQGSYRDVQAAFDRVEEFLALGDSDVRAWVAGFFQTLQETASWDRESSDVFLRFLGAHSRHVWATLEAIRADLTQCSILEAEVQMWRVVHRRFSSRLPEKAA